MQALYDLPAPAKLNLFLHITGRRADGYHLLQSAFMLIDWCDLLHIERRPHGRLSRTDWCDAAATEVAPAQDLCLRAAHALQQATGCRQGAHITLAKHIPLQAGMGGGSSDAATCLLALNRLWCLGLTRGQLAHIGLGLGADVPFFLFGQNAWVEGIGEQLSPLRLAAARFMVVKPAAGVATRDIFGAADLKRDTIPATMLGFTADPYGFGRNDMQAVAERLCPSVAQAGNWLSSLGLQARMTGSGSAVFAPLPADDEALAQLGDKASSAPAGCFVRICSNLEVHPLAGWASGDG